MQKIKAGENVHYVLEVHQKKEKEVKNEIRYFLNFFISYGSLFEAETVSPGRG